MNIESIAKFFGAKKYYHSLKDNSDTEQTWLIGNKEYYSEELIRLYDNTFLDCKNKIAIESGYPSWEEMENWIINHNTLPVVVAQLLVAAMERVCKLMIEQNKIL